MLHFTFKERLRNNLCAMGSSRKRIWYRLILVGILIILFWLFYLHMTDDGFVSKSAQSSLFNYEEVYSEKR